MFILCLLPSLTFICANAILFSYICYRCVFFAPKKPPLPDGEYDIPRGEKYTEYAEQFILWSKKKREMPCLDLSVTSFDGLKLYGKYFEYRPGAAIEILFHGYRGSAERDLSVAIERCFSMGRSALLVDQRAAGASEGRVISFGINECRDCLSWINKVIEHFGEDTEIVLGGISMGAATATMASAEDLPPNVKYVVADCSFTTQKEIMKKIIRQMKLPAGLIYPMIRLSARLFGRFSLEENSPLKAVKNSKVPVIFFHGDGDDFIPHEMSQRLFEECVSQKKLVLIPRAAHGVAYLADKKAYIEALKEFEREIAVFQEQ